MPAVHRDITLTDAQAAALGELAAEDHAAGLVALAGRSGKPNESAVLGRLILEEKARRAKRTRRAEGS